MCGMTPLVRLSQVLAINNKAKHSPVPVPPVRPAPPPRQQPPRVRRVLPPQVHRQQHNMANINGIKGLSTPILNVLLAAYGNDIVNLGSGQGYGLGINPNFPVEFESFLGSLFFQNGNDRPLSFDGTIWNTKHLARPPLGKFLRVWRSRSRLYVGYVTIAGTLYPSRVMFCDLPVNATVQWGFEYGTTLRTVAGSPTVFAQNAGFKTYNVKRGDPFFILSGLDVGQYNVISVDADQQLTLDKPLTTTSLGLSFWAGGNWFDVGPDDGDFITWMEENNDQLCIFKRDSLYKLNASDGSSKTKVRGALGTTSGRSVANLHELTIYYHAGTSLSTGFYAYNGLYAQKISTPIDNHIAGINPGSFPVAWREGELYRAFVGSIVNRSFDLNIPNAVMTWDYLTKTWSIDPLDDVVTCATEFRQGLLKLSYFGTTTDTVMATPLGVTYNNKEIPFEAEIPHIYPLGTQWICEFANLDVISTNMKGTLIQYRRRLTPFDAEKDWHDLGEIQSDLTQLDFGLEDNQAFGIDLRVINISGTTPEGRIDKFTLWYRPKTQIIK